MKLTKQGLTILFLFAVLVIVLFIGVRLSIKAMSPMPPKLGVFYGRLQPCPDTPNCVSSQATDDSHKIEPIAFTGMDRRVAYQILLECINELPRANVLVSRVDYVHVEFRSLVWGFRDDTEFWINDASGLIEVRSASRLGRGDLGVNRKRVEDIRTRFQNKANQLLKG